MLPRESQSPTVPYASPGDFEHVRWSPTRIVAAVTWMVTSIVVTHLVLAVITPNIEKVLIDFKVELPALSQLLLSASRAYRNGYLWVLTTAAFIGIPLLWLCVATPRRRERLPRLMGTLVTMLLVVWVLLGLLLPLLTVYQGMSAAGGKK